MIATVKGCFIRVYAYARGRLRRMNAGPKEHSEMVFKGSTWVDRITPLPPEDRKRLANWRIFSTNTSPQPTKDSPTSAGSEEEKIPPNPREGASQE